MESLAELNATIEKAFHEFDKDGNGTISKEELKELIERLEGSTILDDELNDLFTELDKDNSNEIEYSEFYAWFTSKSTSNKRLKRIATLSKKLFHVDAFTASWNGDIKTIKKFLDSSVGVDSVDETLFGRKNTMLHYAAYAGHFYLCKLLIENGANKYSSNSTRSTPFHYACQTDQDKIIKYFMKDDINSNNIFIPDIEGNSAINVAGPKCRDLLRKKYKFPENNLTIFHNKKFESQGKIEIYLYIQLNEFECFDSINIEIFKKEKNGSWTSIIKTLYSYCDYCQRDRLRENESQIPIDDNTYQLSFDNFKFDATPSVRYKCVASINDFLPTTIKSTNSDNEFENDDVDNDGLDDKVGGNDVELKKSDDVVYGEDEILCCKCVPVKINIIKLIEPPENQTVAPFKWSVVFEYKPCICGSAVICFIIQYRPISGTTYDEMKILLDNPNLIEEKEEGEEIEKKIKKYNFTFTSKSKRIYIKMKAVNNVGEGPISEDFPRPIGFVVSRNGNKSIVSNYGGSNTSITRNSIQSRKSIHSTQSKTSFHSHASNKQQSESKRSSRTSSESKTSENNRSEKIIYEEGEDKLPIEVDNPEKTLILPTKEG